MQSLQPGDTIGAAFPYRIERRIDNGKGNMSEVYLARIERSFVAGVSTAYVALKVARVESDNGEFNSDGLITEVELIRSLTHPGIVHIYPIQQARLSALPFRARSGLPGEPWFSVLEHLRGDTLAAYLSALPQRRLPLEQVLFIARSLVGTLDYLHRCNIVHMDLKPENVLFRFPLTAGNRIEPVLIDFGVACEAGQPEKGGTMRYKAPERIMDASARAHPAMDIYALGVILYQMLTGRMPFTGANRGSITEEILKGEITAPSLHYEPPDGHPGVREHLDEIIRKTMYRDWHARYTAADLSEALEIATLRLDSWPVLHMTMPRPVTTPPGASIPEAPTTSSTARRKLAPAGVVAVILGLLLFLAGWSVNEWVWSGVPIPEIPASPTATQDMRTSTTPSPVATVTASDAIAAAPDNTGPIILPTATETSAPTATPGSTLGATLTSTPSPTTAAPTVTPVPTTAPTDTTIVTPPPMFGPPTIALIAPDNGARVAGFTPYCWGSNRNLTAGEAFELFVWKSDMDYDKENLGITIADPIDNAAIDDPARICVVVNLSRILDEQPQQVNLKDRIVQFNKGDEMYWGIRLIARDKSKLWLKERRVVIPE